MGVQLRGMLVAVLFGNIVGPAPFAFAQAHKTEAHLVQEVIDFARRNGQRQTLGTSVCESLGLKPKGDCEVVQVLHTDPAVFRTDPKGTRHAVNIFEQPGAEEPGLIILREHKDGLAVIALMDRNGVIKRAARRSTSGEAWSVFSLELDPRVLVVLGEFSYWIAQARTGSK